MDVEKPPLQTAAHLPEPAACKVAAVLVEEVIAARSAQLQLVARQHTWLPMLLVREHRQAAAAQRLPARHGAPADLGAPLERKGAP
eukprot:3029745-Prymnesium_polylepis.1